MRDSSSRQLSFGGIERVLVQAALDPGLRRQLLHHRETVLASGTLALSPSEAHILRRIPRAQLATAMERLAVPCASRRGFIRAVPAALVAALASSALGGASGCPAGIADDYHLSCDGSRPDPPACQTNVPGGDYWITLGGRTAFLHLPPSYDPYTPQPLCIAYHDQGQSSLTAVTLWRDTADRLEFLLLAPEWSGSMDEREDMLVMLSGVIAELNFEYCVKVTDKTLVGTGTGATLALYGVLFPPTSSGRGRAVAFGGPLPEDWQATTVWDPTLTYLYLSSTAGTQTFNSIEQDVIELRSRGFNVEHVVHQPDVEPQPDGPEVAWNWVHLP